MTWQQNFWSHVRAMRGHIKMAWLCLKYRAEYDIIKGHSKTYIHNHGDFYGVRVRGELGEHLFDSKNEARGYLEILK